MTKRQKDTQASGKRKTATGARKVDAVVSGAAKPAIPVRRPPPSGLSTRDKSSDRFIVHGVVSISNVSAVGLTVIAFDDDVNGEDRLGKPTLTDGNGRYRIPYSAAQFHRSSRERGGADVFVRVYTAHAVLLIQSKTMRNAAANLRLDVARPEGECVVRGQVRLADDTPVADVLVQAFDNDVRKRNWLGEKRSAADGSFAIRYSASDFCRVDKGHADLTVEVLAADGSVLATSPLLRNAPAAATVDMAIPAEKWPPLTLFEKVARTLAPRLGPLKVEELEEDKEHQDVSFLSGEPGLDKKLLARYVVAHKLARHGIAPEFWFALLGGSFFEFIEDETLEDRATASLKSLSSYDGVAVGGALTRAFDRKDIPELLRPKSVDWTEAFLTFVAKQTIARTAESSFVKLALDHAGIEDAGRQEQVARLLNQHQTLTPAVLGVLEKDGAFKPEEVADLRTSFELAGLTRGNFSVVKMLKEEFAVRQPEQIRTLARKSEGEWVALVEQKLSAGDIQLPAGGVAGQMPAPTAGVYGRTLERQFREAFPTHAFAGGLERALGNGGAQGLRNAGNLSRFLDRHDNFELLNTPVDEFLDNGIHPEVQPLANDEGFRTELKAAQRVFKLAPSFEATDALLADDLHSAQGIYRLGESEFVRRYADTPGFTAESASLAWNRAADTYGTVLTVVGDLKALEGEAVPAALTNNNEALSRFPNWNNLFQSGDLCQCEHCRSALSPAAYFADLLTFLKDRTATATPVEPGDPIRSVKDVLFARRADLGYLELNCANALTQLPYIDVVCEVLEQAVDAAHANALQTTAVPTASNEDAKHAVAAALNAAFVDTLNIGKEKIELGDDFSLSQVNPADPDRWVVHGDNVTYLMTSKQGKKARSVVFEILPNTKATAAELRAYPQYVNPKAYEQLRKATYPLTLPFDLFAEEVRAAFKRSNVQRWDLMRTLRGDAKPNNPSDGDIAAEYFGISVDASAASDEKRLMLHAEPTASAQQRLWGETGPGWLARVANVKTFLQKTGLEYTQLLELLDLKFVNLAGALTIRHLDASCDTDKKVIETLDPAILDRLHRFLRLSRKLQGWKMWELDLVIGHASVGKDHLDEAFLVNLFYFSRLRTRLGDKTTIEQVCALFGDLNTRSRFTALHERRGDALYQTLFLNNRLISPLDPTFAIDPLTHDITLLRDPLTGARQQPVRAGHRPVILAALGISESDLVVFEKLTTASDPTTTYITGDLTVTNLSFLWRHAWLARLLKFKADEWKTLLQIVHDDVARFSSPEAALKFVEQVDAIKASGFSVDELNWLLAADRSAKAAPKDADAARFLGGLRKDVQAIRAEYDGASPPYGFLSPAEDVDKLTTLLVSLLQKLNRDEPGIDVFLKTLRGSVVLEAGAQGLPAAFAFPASVAAADIPIVYEKQPVALFRFTGMMTEAQRAMLLGAARPAAVKDNSAYASAIEELFQSSLTAPDVYTSNEIDVALPGGLTLPVSRPSIPIRYDSASQKLRFVGVMTDAERVALDIPGNPVDAIEALFHLPRNAVKFLAPVFTAPLQTLPPAIDFDAQLPADVAAKISYDVEQRLLRFAGVMSDAEQSAIDGLAGSALPVDTAYRAAVNSLKSQPEIISLSDDRIFMIDEDLDEGRPGNATLAGRLANAAGKALGYLAQTLAVNAIVTESSAQLGLTEALTRRLLTAYEVVPSVSGQTKTTLIAHLTGNFAIDASTLDGWFWADRVARMWGRWKITLAELENIDAITAGATLLDPRTLPLDAAGPVASLEQLLRTSRLLEMRDRLPEPEVTLLEVLSRLNAGAYATATNSVADQKHLFATDVARLNAAWSASDMEVFTATLDLTYPADYLLAETWERLRDAFSFLDKLNAGADMARTFAAPAMTPDHAKAFKELLRARFGAETWLTVSAEIQDSLRERKRDALAAYLLSRAQPADAPSRKWENTNDLYAYHLLDVDMAPCQLTSRLVQASGSVQLFVQRCFMGLEPDVIVHADGATGDSAWRWWKWMRKYRVWEANRAVFLWPENVIEPELKKDRSSFFKDMENELLQNDVNQYSVESAFASYLEKLNGVAQLEIAGFHQEDDGENAILHVFGRTAGTEPHLYYYRRYDYRQWTPWEKVELEIQGEYLVPAVVNKRLFLFWPVFTEVPDEAGNGRMTVPAPGQKRFTPDQTAKKLRLQMAISEYRQGQWTAKKVSKDFEESKSYKMEIVKQHYRFFFIDRSNVGGQVGVQYDGYSVGSEAAALKTKADLDDAAKVASDDQGEADTAKTAALSILGHAKPAVTIIQVAADQAKTFITFADNLLAGIQSSLSSYGVTASFAFAAREAVGTAMTKAADGYSSLVPGAAAADDDAAVDARIFNDALVALHTAFENVRLKAAAGNNSGIVAPYAVVAVNAAHAAADAGAESLRSARSLRDGAASDAKSASKEAAKAKIVADAAATARDDYKFDYTKQAIWSGFFEISGCTGVPERTPSAGTFTNATRPQQAAVGEAAVFSRWVELTPRLGLWPPDDFALENHFFARPSIADTPVLGETPDTFKMSPAWHFSFIDKIGLESDSSYPRTATWLPFFYNDKRRTFFVLPSTQLDDATGTEVRAYYPALKKYFEQTIASDMALMTEAGVGFDLRQYLNAIVMYAEDRLQSQKLHFKNFYHPHVCDFSKLIYNPLEGIPSLMSRRTQLMNSGFSFEESYQPADAVAKLPPQYPLLTDCYPVEAVDFTADGAYSPYNWELFFHAPLLIANSLSRNQRFEDAREWYHFIFNPLGVESVTPGGSPMSKYWITKPFFETTVSEYVAQRIENIMRMLAGDSSLSGYSSQGKADLEAQVRDWRINPFEPHRIANYRTVAYQKTVVMKYLDNLISWGDNLFRQDGMENLNEATQLYILAAEILGPRPKTIPPRAKPPVESFNELEHQFDAFSNALVEVENLIPAQTGNGQNTARVGPYKAIGPQTSAAPLPTLYFCVPQNAKMIGYWDTVADRLYKIRHCMTIDGVSRQVALFEPAIDPAALVKAVAGGADIGAALADLNSPLPLYRFNVLLQKANEVCNDVKALGAALLSALEKKDGEDMTLVRQGQELKLLEAVKALRQQQVEEARENLTGIKKSKALTEAKRDHYRDIERLTAKESLHIGKMDEAGTLSEVAQHIKLGASIISYLPAINLGVSGFGATPLGTFKIGGLELGQAASLASEVLSYLSQIASNDAAMASAQAGFERRDEDWTFQELLADKELEQIDRQIAAAQLRIAIAEKELDNHVTQIENAKAIDAFMRSKYTNRELYQWQTGQISGVYFQSYKLAYDLAKQAERCFRFELGVRDSSYVNFGYWDSLKKGLLSGEKLQYDLRRLETAYLEQNHREYELTKHVSLALVDPVALVKLRETGRCFLRLPEEIFDLDYPGHYFRRIKSVSLTLPCVVGPYTTISCTLRLLKNSIRINTANGDDGTYARNADERGLPADDSRFIENNIPVKAIAASNAQNDSGVFELNFRDDRYLPFEGAGTVSQWALELFSDADPDFGKPLRQFDYNTISDAILHVKYTAREDSGRFKDGAVDHLREYFSQDDATPSVRLFNLRQEFPSEWYRFLHPANASDDNVLEFEMSQRLFPFRDGGDKILKVNSIVLLARCSDDGPYSVVFSPPLPAPPPPAAPPAAPTVDPNKMTLTPVAQYGGLHVSQKDVSALGPIEIDPTAPPATWSLTMTGPGGGHLREKPDGKTMEVEDLLLVLGYEWE